MLTMCDCAFLADIRWISDCSGSETSTCNVSLVFRNKTVHDITFDMIQSTTRLPNCILARKMQTLTLNLCDFCCLRQVEATDDSVEKT